MQKIIYSVMMIGGILLGLTKPTVHYHFTLTLPDAGVMALFSAPIAICVWLVTYYKDKSLRLISALLQCFAVEILGGYLSMTFGKINLDIAGWIYAATGLIGYIFMMIDNKAKQKN